MAEAIKPPPGFEIDPSNLPEGFVLDKPAQKPSLGQNLLTKTMRSIPQGPVPLLMGLGQEVSKYANEKYDEAAYNAGGWVTDKTANMVSPEVAGGLGYATNVGIQSLPVLLSSFIGGKSGGEPMKDMGRGLMRGAVKPTIKQHETGEANMDEFKKFKEWGKQGGLKGGPARMRKLSKAQRSAIARLGGLARAQKAREAK